MGYRIRVNAIIPSVVETSRIDNLIGESGAPEATRAAYEGISMPKRMANVDYIAGLVACLASDEAAFISGLEYVVARPQQQG